MPSNHVRHARLALSALLALAACGGCGLNQSGNISSSQSGGDTGHPATRSSPLVELDTACANDAVVAAPEIKRQPYLQQVTSSSAMVGWVTTKPEGARIDVTLPDGSAVTTATGEDEATATRAAGEHQMWSQLDGLEASTIYCYTVATDTGQLTPRAGFRTAPAADSTAPVRFLAFGDSGGGGDDQHVLREQMDTVPFDLIIHTGDVAYDSGTISEFEDNVFGVYADLFKSIPFFPAAGNHDYETMKGAPFRSVFALPGDSGEKWYSYDWGQVHFASIDTEADYKTQAAWLDKDLAATKLPWKIVYLHRPPYSSGEHGSDMSLRAALAPVFEKHGVQLVLAGHDHDYERMKTQGGVDYVVTGGGGRGTRPVGSSSFTAFSDDVIHFVYVEVAADKLVLHAIDGSGKEFDSLVVPQKR